MLKELRDHFLRIDARSLGLFRVAMGLVLIGDLLQRLRWARDFYSNEGVLPNHNHLFNLRGKQEVWSLFHAFSTQGESYVALLAALLAYVFFLVGWRTRVFHVLSLAALVSLTSRNILAEGAGNHAAIALLAFTVFLPLGSRFSLDSLLRSLELRDERGEADLNDRRPIAAASIEAGRLPGWSPVTVAALGVLLQIAAIYACSYLQKTGDAWRDGSALHYALHVDRWVSGLGAWMRGALGAGPLGGWSHALRYVEIAVPALLFVPVAFRWTRLAAAALMAFHGLTLGLLFELGLYGWSLVAAAALVVPPGAWDALERSPRASRARTVIYGADCGVCLWLSRLLRRADLRGHLTFQANDALDELLVRGPSGKVERKPMPKEVTPKLVEDTLVVVDRQGRVFTRGRAVVESIGALPLGWLALPLRLPVLSQLLDALYDAVASRRHAISAAMGKDVCPIARPAAAPEAEAEEAGEAQSEAQTEAQAEARDEQGRDEREGDEREEAEEAAPRGERRAPRRKRRARAAAADAPAEPEIAVPVEVAPAVRTGRHVAGAARELGAALVLAAMVAQTARANPVPAALADVPQGPLLAAVASWPRMLARWDVLAPEPPRENGAVVVDAQNRAGIAVDPFTAAPPEVDLAARGPLHLGTPWVDYLDRIRRPEHAEFQRAFRDYLGKGGPMRWNGGPEALISGLDVYWVTQPIPPPGGGAAGPAQREKVFSHGRGGLGVGLDKVPLAPPGARR